MRGQGLRGAAWPSLNSVMEDALAQMLGRARNTAERGHVELPVSGGGGLLPRWDPSADIKDIADQAEAEEYREAWERDAAR